MICQGDDFGVCAGMDGVSEGLELGFELNKIKDFTVEDELVPVQEGHRLRPFGAEVQNREPSVPEADVEGVREVEDFQALTIWTAVGHRVGHGGQKGGVDGMLRKETE